jgi:hypothetical protein
MGTEQQSNRLVADRGEAEWSRWLTLESLGARTMTPEQLAELSVALQALAADANELRVLQLEHRRRLLEGIPNRPSIGYYLQLRRRSACSADE